VTELPPLERPFLRQLVSAFTKMRSNGKKYKKCHGLVDKTAVFASYGTGPLLQPLAVKPM